MSSVSLVRKGDAMIGTCVMDEQQFVDPKEDPSMSVHHEKISSLVGKDD